MSAPQSDPPAGCAGCRHFFVTWQAPRSRGCRALGFISADWPGDVVQRESGLPCQLREPRPSSGTPGGSPAGTRRL